MTSTRVVYVGGVIRSGSTLLDRMLGELPGHVSVGELTYLWEHSVLHDQDCGCGRPFSQCPFWTKVGEEAFGGWAHVDAEEMLALQRSLDATKMIPALVAPRIAPAVRQRLERYVDVLDRLYAAIASAGGARVVVDSSKHAGPAYLLRRVPGVDLRVVQIVRDPRGVAYSLTKTVRRPERTSVDEYMSVWPPRQVARRWVTTNLLVAGLARFGIPVVRLRYEDLVANPRKELTRVSARVDQPLAPDALGFIGEGTAELPRAHSLDGNPMRFSTGPVPLRPDEAWRSSLAGRDRRVVDVATWPL